MKVSFADRQYCGRLSQYLHHLRAEVQVHSWSDGRFRHITSNMTKHEFEVAMTCEGCSGAVTRVLNKLGDVKFEVDLPKKLVWIESDKDVEVLMETLKKCGKEVKYNGTK
ncbi:copper transport protein ATOX1 [Xiphias gladius]|uniref:copper transport protein ATOX1 n=1 Tax=Xiphias gladius TaxID=8245 RepID=UPI001A98B94E|nr:copper transport protein ATOX1 [Xiphias gladius]